MRNLATVEFKNNFVNNFEGDQSGDNHPRQTPGVFYSKVLPTPVEKVSLLAWSDELAKELEIEKPSISVNSDTDKKNIDILGGNFVSPFMRPYAACYAGHQFGNWAGQLGDGRAITLGELQTSSGKTWELQLKGPGKTPYSRMADGRAVLRSSVREYLMSEAMFYLNVPTTRALSLVTTGEKVMRDMFYDGNPEFEPGAIVMRVAESFLRFGNFEMPAARGEIDNLKKLVDWTIARYFPQISGENKIIEWYREVVQRTASLMVEWMRVGFVHGVMNTDNMSVLGLTIDYGPYSFIDNYDPNFTPNTTDLPGKRYAFGKQPSIAKWNLGCLGGAISTLVPNTEDLVKVLDEYDDFFWSEYYQMIAGKLGIDKVTTEDVALFNEFEKVLRTLQPDMTIFYQLLINFPDDVQNLQQVLHHFEESFYKQPQEKESEMLFGLMKKYSARINANIISRQDSVALMKRNNPRFILRNYLLHQAIEELENGNDTLFVKLQQAMKEPYSERFNEFFSKRPYWANQKAGCSMLSCSS